jgi:hypothetical protein
MRPLACVILLSLALLLAGCARHFVVERDQGRVDGARSIASNSDEQWTIEREPEAAKDVEH